VGGNRYHAFQGQCPRKLLPRRVSEWCLEELLPHQQLEAHTRHFFGNEIQRAGPVTHVRFNIFPDGGVARLRVYGKLCRDGLERLNALLPDEARAELLACCASARWASRMAAQRPFETREELFHTADLLWWSLDPQDWTEAFGSQSTFELRGGNSAQLGALTGAFEAYSQRFSHTLVCHLPGAGVEDLLAAVQARLANDPERELRVAAEEQGKIARHKLEKLVSL
jgi:hypothetical protein